jgi:stage II sporulation protein D
LLNSFKVKPGNAELKERIYSDDLRLSVNDGKFLIINHVEIESYVAGVVQSEGGGSVKDNDFYLVQAITCRTYALNNLKKHSKEGFNLCDSVHCQLYQNRCKSYEILAATYKTAGDVIVDKDNRMISAAFHANSGGQTINSENIWSIPTSYLKAVKDTFSLKMPNATWEYKILQTNWLDYLKTRFNYDIADPAKKNYAITFKQDIRQVNFTDSIPLTIIRQDLGLKSTWFSIVDNQGGYLIFKGKGYGHGVGLSQQGAIRMAQLGYSYMDIIKFYYKDVNVINYDELMIK